MHARAHARLPGNQRPGDPLRCTRQDDTPACTGLRDGADATLPWWSPGATSTQGPVRAADGAPLARPAMAPALGAEPTWMTQAEEDARHFKGRPENKIEKEPNFAKPFGTGQTTLVGEDHPWCTAFVNWGLQESGVEIGNATSTDHVAA